MVCTFPLERCAELLLFLTAAVLPEALEVLAALVRLLYLGSAEVTPLALPTVVLEGLE